MKQFVTILTLVVTLSTSALAQNNSLESVFILNEGNFNAGNATLTHFETSNSTTSQAVFLTANSTGLGDVGQSLAWINKKIFAVINNSGKVVVIDPDSYAQVGQISLGAFSSPREIVPVSETKAYVTDLYGNKLYIVDLDDYSISSTSITLDKGVVETSSTLTIIDDTENEEDETIVIEVDNIKNAQESDLKITITILKNDMPLGENTKRIISSIYPNPTNKYFVIEFSEIFELEEINMVDPLGRVYDPNIIEINKKQLKIDSSVLSGGTHILRLKTDKGSASFRIIVE